MSGPIVGPIISPIDDADCFDIDAWLDAHDDAPAREELEPHYSSGEAA